MKLLITGAGGTVGTALRHFILSQRPDINFIPWDRERFSLGETHQLEPALLHYSPDVVLNLAVPTQGQLTEEEHYGLNVELPQALVSVCKKNDVRFVQTSTVKVFADGTAGPLTMETTPNEPRGYGYQKRLAEEKVLTICPEALIVRLGWQVDLAKGDNTMFDFLWKAAKKGAIPASTEWYPSCSFVQQTAQELINLISAGKSGIYMLNQNKKWNFFEIAKALGDYTKAGWEVVPTRDFVFDQRMEDERLSVAPLERYLPALHAK